MNPPPYVRIIGPKNSGKTCLVEALVGRLSSLGLRVGTIKHDAHDFQIDHPGKDTWRHRQAGSVTTLICSATQLALMSDLSDPPAVADLVQQYFGNCDVVLVEGYKSDTGPAICLGGVATTGQALARLPCGYDLSEDQLEELALIIMAVLER